MRGSLALRRWSLIPVLAIVLLIGVSAVPASAQYYGSYYGSPYGSYYGSTYGSPYSYGSYGSYGYPYSYNSYSYPYSNSSYGYPYSYNSYSYPYNNYSYNSYSYPYSNYSYGYPYNSSYNYGYPYTSSSYGYPYTSSSYGYPYNNGYNYGYPYGYNYGYPYGYSTSCSTTSYYYDPSCTGYAGALTAPSGLVVSNVGVGTATLTWSAVAGATSYIVLQSSNGSAYTAVSYPTTNTATITGLVGATTFSFEVVAVANGVQSAASAPVSTNGTGTGVGTVGAPVGLAVATKTSNTVTLTWTPVSGAASYRVYESVGGSGFTQIPGTVNSNAVTVASLTNNTTYIFEVASVDIYGNAGTPSAPITVTTNP